MIYIFSFFFLFLKNKNKEMLLSLLLITSTNSLLPLYNMLSSYNSSLLISILDGGLYIYIHICIILLYVSVFNVVYSLRIKILVCQPWLIFFYLYQTASLSYNRYVCIKTFSIYICLFRILIILVLFIIIIMVYIYIFFMMIVVIVNDI